MNVIPVLMAELQAPEAVAPGERPFDHPACPSPWHPPPCLLFCSLGRLLDDFVRRTTYSYHADVEGSEDRPIFRYDNAHRYGWEGQGGEHHKHRYDHSSRQETEPPEWIGRDGWPHLHEVIEELRAWWEGTGRHLDLTGTTGRDGESGSGATEGFDLRSCRRRREVF